MGALSPEERPIMGALVNDVREAIQQALEAKQATLEQAEVEKN